MNRIPPPGSNRLIFEKSPYLLQHAHNPVDWHPWGEEAFSKAKAEDKPILLSIGYSTCHWCHVMERESFENANTALAMNKWLVAIKLDREERPDIDAVYMAACTALTGQGGWPLNVFLTHDLKPFYAGTYFPPAPAYGRPSFMQLVEGVGKAWKTPVQREQLLQDSQKLTEALLALGRPGEASKALDASWLENGFQSFQRAFEPEYAAFSPAPKFPMPVNLGFLFRCTSHAEEAKAMALAQLRAMADGGIHDHLGGGFARYSTDERWHVPHFEKMLYDNAQLATAYLEGYQISGDERLAEVARGIFTYVSRDLTSPQGAFYSAEDADSAEEGADHKVEGAFYAWTEAEIDAELGKDAAAFKKAYGVKTGGNVSHDPHGDFHGKNVLFAAGASGAELAAARQKLLAKRSLRPRPHRDEKVLAAWSGLMISGYAKGFQVLGDAQLLAAAKKAMQFVLDELDDEKTGILYRRWADGERAVEGTADDYANVIQALLDLFECEGEEAWLKRALKLSERAQVNFFDQASGAYYSVRQGSDARLLVRFTESQDNVEPSAASTQIKNLLRLSLFTGQASLRSDGEKALKALGPTMHKSPRAAAAMLASLDMALGTELHIVVVGEPGSDMAKAMQKAWAPRRALLMLKPGQASHLEFAKGFEMKDGKATAYICVNQACKLPTTNNSEALKLLN